MLKPIFQPLKTTIHNAVTILNLSFNRLSKSTKRSLVVVFGICVTGISGMLVQQALGNQENRIQFKHQRVVMPYDISGADERKISDKQLRPIGKMEGETDGQFDSFCVAVDKDGSIFINRNIAYSQKAYEKSSDWKQISREKLIEYERDLHFIPMQARGIKK
ncbi:MAG TPA: hypothetical protein VGD40_23220 [Chryseosolibacter sp.]